MEKFIRIAESINELSVFSMYEIARLDIQLHGDDYQFHAYLTLQGTEGNRPLIFIFIRMGLLRRWNNENNLS